MSVVLPIFLALLHPAIPDDVSKFALELVQRLAASEAEAFRSCLNNVDQELKGLLGVLHAERFAVIMISCSCRGRTESAAEGGGGGSCAVTAQGRKEVGAKADEVDHRCRSIHIDALQILGKLVVMCTTCTHFRTTATTKHRQQQHNAVAVLPFYVSSLITIHMAV